MTIFGWIQIGLYVAALLALAKPLGAYMARVYEGQPCGLDKVLGPGGAFVGSHPMAGSEHRGDVVAVQMRRHHQVADQPLLPSPLRGRQRAAGDALREIAGPQQAPDVKEVDAADAQSRQGTLEARAQLAAVRLGAFGGDVEGLARERGEG